MSTSELENQFILRMPTVKDENGNSKPHPSAAQLREALNKINLTDPASSTATSIDTDNLKERLFIELNTETRKGRIKFDNETFEARLVDLPCIVESLKTVDKKTFFKTADICQMLVCKTADEPWSSSDEDGSKKKDKKKQSESTSNNNNNNNNNNNKKFLWPHGIAPPLKNVRRKRFRKVAKKKVVDYVEIEREVKQLFRADREAIKIDYEVVLVDGELEDENNDDENKNSLNNEDDFDDSSQEDENNAMMNAECSNTGYIDSTNMDSNNMAASSTMKSKRLDESNMSSAIDDDDSSMMLNSASKLKLKRDHQTYDNNEDGDGTMNPTNFDELSNDNSNFTTSKTAPKRTGFKDLFVEQVIGDLSSSSDEDDQDDDDEEENKNSKTSSSFKFNLNKNSVHTAAVANKNKTEESSSNSAAIAGTSASNSGVGQDGSGAAGRSGPVLNEDSVSNFDDFEISNSQDEEDDDDNDENDDDDEEKTSKDVAESKNNAENTETKIKLQIKLAELEQELEKIREDRRKKENELNSIKNPVLKAQFTPGLNNLINEENKKLNEIEQTKFMLNQ